MYGAEPAEATHAMTMPRVGDAAEVLEAPPQLPNGERGYLACRTCRRILSEPQWYAEGCLECGTGPVPRGELMDYATSHFSNFIGLVAPEKSWVARFLGKTHSPNGVYAEALSDDSEDAGGGDDEEDVDSHDATSEADAEYHLQPGEGAVAARQERMTDEELLGL